ncbi:unnamed protein product [Phytophthora fragariaefolia]|uniref:Unnamed protein product n=1 Tax=Phytophthora fragariaefolia TaxID=1490495 RepID=A0A9W6YEG9_9STRA|nr:unnamed protein product [Phytophthora fragariaefolia]
MAFPYIGYSRVVCRTGDQKHPVRLGQFNCFATHCAKCGPALGMRSVFSRHGFCQFELDNGTGCAAEATFSINGEPRCNKHKEDQAKDSCRCQEPGCMKFKVQHDYCNRHAMDNRIAISTNCVDCREMEILKTGSNGSEVGRLCLSCTKTRVKYPPKCRWWRIAGYMGTKCTTMVANYGPEGGKPTYCAKCRVTCGHPH